MGFRTLKEKASIGRNDMILCVAAPTAITGGLVVIFRKPSNTAFSGGVLTGCGFGKKMCLWCAHLEIIILFSFLVEIPF